jgi:hypothetical protein
MILSQRKRPAFRLNDLVAVAALLVVAVGVLGPALAGPKEAEARTACANKLKDLGLAVHNYAGAYQNNLPALTSDVARPRFGAYNGDLFFSLLPFLEDHVEVFETGLKNPNSTWYAAIAPSTVLPFGMTPPAKDKLPLSAHPVKYYQCPADETISKGLSANQTATNVATAPYYFPWAASSYAANYQVFGANNDFTKANWGNACGSYYNIGNIPDGTSNTVFFGEQWAACGSTAGSLWAYPGIGNYSGTSYTSTPGTAAPQGANGLTNASGKTTSKYWMPTFANSNATYGFTSGGLKGSIAEHNSRNANEKPIVAPFAAGLYWDAPPQVDIRPADCDKSRLQSFHPGVVAVGMGDGSVRHVRGKLTQSTWWSAIGPSDGTVLGPDW